MLVQSLLRRPLFVSQSVRMFSIGGKSHNAPSSNIKDTHFKFPKHTELFAEDYYDDRLRDDAPKRDPFMRQENDFERHD